MELNLVVSVLERLCHQAEKKKKKKTCNNLQQHATTCTKLDLYLNAFMIIDLYFFM